jgi:hypothetical protein
MNGLESSRGEKLHPPRRQVHVDEQLHGTNFSSTLEGLPLEDAH